MDRNASRSIISLQPVSHSLRSSKEVTAATIAATCTLEAISLRAPGVCAVTAALCATAAMKGPALLARDLDWKTRLLAVFG